MTCETIKTNEAQRGLTPADVTALCTTADQAWKRARQDEACSVHLARPTLCRLAHQFPTFGAHHGWGARRVPLGLDARQHDPRVSRGWRICTSFCEA